jgi:hypothetical protein
MPHQDTDSMVRQSFDDAIIREVLAWLEERAKNSTSFGHHCHAYEVAARRLRIAIDGEPTPSAPDASAPAQRPRE